MRIIQISDSHISLQAPARLEDLKSCVAAVNTLGADLVVHTGDISHDGLAEEYQLAKGVLDTLNAPYWVIPGNRDKREVLMNIHAGRFCSDGEFLQYALEDYPLRLVMIDTVSTSSNKGQLCERRLQHIEQMLTADDSKPCIVFMHHTPFEVSEIPDPLQFEDWAVVEKLTAMFSQCENLKAVYCGHVHRNVEARIGRLPISAISCMARDLRKGEPSNDEKNRPMYRLIEYPEQFH